MSTSIPYSRLEHPQKPASALVTVSAVRLGDLIDLGIKYGGFLGGLFHVGEINGPFQDGTYSFRQGRRHFCFPDEIEDIPADAQFVVFRKYFPKKK